MDTNAITGALTKALGRYPEIQNADRYKNLEESARKETIARELSRDIETLLAAQPEFGADRVVSTGLVSMVLATALVRVGLSRGTTAAVVWLQKILNTTKARGFEVQALRGIRVASAISLAKGIKLVPFCELPDSRQKQGLSVTPSFDPYHLPAFYAFTPPNAALVVPVEIKPFFVKSSTAVTQRANARANWRARFEDIRHCLAISQRTPIVQGPSWSHYEDLDYEEAAVVRNVMSYSHQEVTPMLAGDPVELDLRHAARTVRAYFALDKVARQKVRTAMERVHLALIRSSPADKSLELSIALETLLVDSPGENTFKISLRSALLTAENIDTRHTNREVIRAAYNLRSALVHSGRSSHKVKVGKEKMAARDVAERATVITIDVIRAVLTAGKIPDWSNVDLSPISTSTG